MKKVYKVFGLDEIQVLTACELYGHGLASKVDNNIQRVPLGTFDTEIEAISYTSDIIADGLGQYDHGIEIVGVYVKA